MSREVYEEIGLRTHNPRLTGVYSEGNLRIIPPAREHVVVLAFRCDVVGGPPCISDEVAEVGYFRLGSFPHLIVPTHPGRVEDAIRTGPPIVT